MGASFGDVTTSLGLLAGANGATAATAGAVAAVAAQSNRHSGQNVGITDEDAQAVLGRSIEHAAERVLDGKLPTAWAGEQLVALIRHLGVLSPDWEMPDAFREFDLVMMDLECFPDGGMDEG